MFKKWVEFLPMDGSKSYIAGFALMIWGIAGFFGFVSVEDPVLMIFNGLGLLGIRHALSKSGIEQILALAPQVIAIIQEIRKRQVNPKQPIEVPDVEVNGPVQSPPQPVQTPLPQPMTPLPQQNQQ